MPGTDEALVAYPSTQPRQRRFSHADWLGSIVALSDNSGTAVAINAYDEFAIARSLVLSFSNYRRDWLLIH
jgi:hypothetical protein